MLTHSELQTQKHIEPSVKFPGIKEHTHICKDCIFQSYIQHFCFQYCAFWWILFFFHILKWRWRLKDFRFVIFFVIFKWNCGSERGQSTLKSQAHVFWKQGGAWSGLHLHGNMKGFRRSSPTRGCFPEGGLSSGVSLYSIIIIIIIFFVFNTSFSLMGLT